MFNLMEFTSLYLAFGKGVEESSNRAMGGILIFLVIRYVLFSISLFVSLREFEGKGSLLAFVPFARYYKFGRLSGSGTAGAAALAASLLWFIVMIFVKGTLVFALASSIAFFTDIICSVLFARRAETGALVPGILSSLGFNFISVFSVVLCS